MPQQCRPSEGRPPFDDVPTIQIFPGKLAFITSGQRISFQRCQPTIPPRIVQAGLAGWLAGKGWQGSTIPASSTRALGSSDWSSAHPIREELRHIPRICTFASAALGRSRRAR